MRCYICLESTAPLVTCTQAPCAWAWHSDCQRQRDLVPGPGDGQWVPITCESGHLQTAGPEPTRKRVRKQWLLWACRWRGLGVCGIAWAAIATFALWLVSILWTMARLYLIKRLVMLGTFLLCAAFAHLKPYEVTMMEIWASTLSWVTRVTLHWSVVVAGLNFFHLLVDCWRLRTVDYV